MADKREKIISYRRADFLISNRSLTLEKCIRDALTKLPTMGQRWVIHGEHVARVANEKAASGGLLVHVTTETPGEFASIVPKVPAASAGLDLKTQKPPPDGEWLDGDAFLFVQDDHICVCTTGVREGAVKAFFRLLFQKARMHEDTWKFDFTKVADIGRVKMIKSQGVKEVEIRATLTEATAHYEKRKSPVNQTIGIAAKHLKAIFGKANDVTEDALKICLTLKTDIRMRGLALGEKRIEHFAIDVVNDKEDHDDYVIVTKTGQRISPKEIFVKTNVSIDRDGKTVQRDKAWKELAKFFSDLKSLGILEQ